MDFTAKGDSTSKRREFDAFADKSVAASDTIEVDNRKFGEIIQEEIDRINAKRACVVE